MKRPEYFIEPGRPYPLGATVDDTGVNFSLFSENATAIELLLFAYSKEDHPFLMVPLDPAVNRTNHFWHVYLRGLKPGVQYAYRISGPCEVCEGHRFNPNKVILDPYAKGTCSHRWERGAACHDGDNLSSAMRGVVIDPRGFDWGATRPPRTPMKDSVIYEMHVAGFTRNPNSRVDRRGKFLGAIEKIPYLKELGVTAVELLPVFQFDDREILRTLPDGTELRNYWGYSTVGYFSPENSYCVNPAEGEHLNEFREMVKAFHAAGIEVILDVVYNHTDEGNHQGPVYSFKGIDNRVYYHLVPGDRRYYMDYTGCGNTVNCNHPVVQKMITDSLTFWVTEMQVDGFRFDEGSILSRDEEGRPMRYAPVLWAIDLKERFADTKLIAEAWDAGGLYQIGTFPGYRWAEWNGRFRDDVRRFVKGDPGVVGAVASRIAGSSDLYQHERHTPLNSINFVACHDGFTLYDLTAYNEKHNEANGEGNRDGIDDNLSWNSGVEGDTGDPEVLAFRKRRIKNFAAILLLSQGVPMILMGDEVGKSQRGNNNAYCQDNELAWFDWELVEKNVDLFRFFKEMIAFRKANAALRRGAFFDGSVNARGRRDIEWHGCRLGAPGWNDPASKVLAFTMGAFAVGEPDIHVMMNMDPQALDFEVPPAVPGRRWCRFADTALSAPQDISEPGKETAVAAGDYRVKPYSVVILIEQ